jgi:hypothetical protein
MAESFAPPANKLVGLNVAVAPTAGQGLSLDAAGKVPQKALVEAWHEVGTPGEPAFTNSWVNFSTTFNSAAFYKDALGIVHLKGLVKNGTITAAIFQLSVGYRPSNTCIFSVDCNPNAHARLDIQADGQVIPQSGNNTYMSLDGISFRAA